jgi:iron complex outermembrane receptor protein
VLTVKALLGGAYRNPNIYEAVQDGIDPESDDALKREKTSAREFVADWKLSDTLRLSASAYRYNVKDMIEQVVDADGDLVFVNASSAKAHGVELEGEYLAPGGLRVRSSISRQGAHNDAGQRLSNSPEWLAKLHATAPVPHTPLRAALELQGIGQRITESRATLPSLLLTNFSLDLSPPGQRWSASLTLHNVFDRKYSDPTSSEYRSDRVEQDGREATLRLRFSF